MEGLFHGAPQQASPQSRCTSWAAWDKVTVFAHVFFNINANSIPPPILAFLNDSIYLHCAFASPAAAVCSGRDGGANCEEGTLCVCVIVMFSECLKHLRVCEVFKAKGGEVVSAPEKKKSEIDTLKAEMAAIRGDISAIWSIVGGGDPAPTTMVELKERLPQKVDEIGVKRKREEELSVYHGWTKKEEKELRTIVRGDMLEANKRS